MTPDNVKDLCLYAWVGEDEHGSGQVGLKQALVPVGLVPLAAIESHLDRMDADYLKEQLQKQANKFGKTIRLCKFRFIEEVTTLEPEEEEYA